MTHLFHMLLRFLITFLGHKIASTICSMLQMGKLRLGRASDLFIFNFVNSVGKPELNSRSSTSHPITLLFN